MAASSDYLVFADESGDHGMAQINADYPVFVLSCCVFDRTQYVEKVCPEIQRFKMRWWPHDAVVLHSSQIKRRQGSYQFLSVQHQRQLFMEDLTLVLASLPFTLIACVVDKYALRKQSATRINPYALALKICMESVYAFLRDRSQQNLNTPFLVEKRGKVEDAELALDFGRVCNRDNRYGKFPGFSIEFVDKRTSLAGLQISDLVSTPIGRHFLRPNQPNRAFAMIERKFRRSPEGLLEGWGLTRFP
jgi:hypothetical protein